MFKGLPGGFAWVGGEMCGSWGEMGIQGIQGKRKKGKGGKMKTKYC